MYVCVIGTRMRTCASVHPNVSAYILAAKSPFTYACNILFMHVLLGESCATDQDAIAASTRMTLGLRKIVPARQNAQTRLVDLRGTHEH